MNTVSGTLVGAALTPQRESLLPLVVLPEEPVSASKVRCLRMSRVSQKSTYRRR